MGEFDVGPVAFRCRSRACIRQNVRRCPSRRTDESHPARGFAHCFDRRGKQLTPLHAKPFRLWRPKINHQNCSHIKLSARKFARVSIYVAYVVRDPMIWILSIAHGHSLPEYWIFFVGRAAHTSVCLPGIGESGARAQLAFQASSVATSCRKQFRFPTPLSPPHSSHATNEPPPESHHL
jgi:hypothetical protein